MPATKTPKTNGSPHPWHFYRAGGVDQVRLDRGSDIVQLGTLDQKLWVALSCPVKGLEFDERTLALLDTDQDGRVRAPEIAAACRWIGRMIRNHDELVAGTDGVPLSSIDTSHDEGKRLRKAAATILASIGEPEAKTITVAQSSKVAEMLQQAPHNGDGVVVPEAIAEPAARKVAEELIACVGGRPDRSGKTGFDQAGVNAFFTACNDFAGWWKQGEADRKTLLPLGDDTPAAWAALQAVRSKVDDYFMRCRLAAYDQRAQDALNREEKVWLEVAAKDLSITTDEVAALPIARVEAGRAMPLTDGVNPAWAGRVDALRQQAVLPTLGKDMDRLTEAEWRGLCNRFAPHGAWIAGKQGAAVESLGIQRVREILAGKTRAVLEQAIADDLAVAPEVEAAGSVERLARLYRDLHRLLNNFVSFTDFYSRRKATFQAGTLYLDGRSCDLCVRVDDASKHAGLAAMARAYLAYVQCTSKTGEKMTVACAFTNGDSDNLFVGRNGLFYDRQGRDWDATIVKIIDNPISIRQAFWSPYKKLVRWIEESVAKRAAAADADASSKLQSAAAATGEAAQTGKAPPTQKSKFDVGVVAALGVAVGGITAALAGVFGAVSSMAAWKLPLIVLGVMLGISGPSMLIAWLKLRQRNLGPILDANGWAVNTLTRINLPLGRVLTDVPVLPAGATRTLQDPYAPKKSIWPRLFLALLLLGAVGFGLWRTGYLHQWWPGCPLPTPETAGPAEPGQQPEAPATGK